jgi:pyridoxamine 5'-phosphate oxidase
MPDPVAFPPNADTSPIDMQASDPFRLFDAWFAEAVVSEPNDPNAMTLATCTRSGVPSARIVLLKAHDHRGFVFYTNKQSRKGDELNANRLAALLFHWKTLRRQVRIEGTVGDVTEAESDAYFAARPRGARIGAWASEQSRPLADRAELERRVAEFEKKYPTDVPRPPQWAGYRVIPSRLEFWKDMPFRLHDRAIFAREGGGWVASRLYP